MVFGRITIGRIMLESACTIYSASKAGQRRCRGCTPQTIRPAAIIWLRRQQGADGNRRRGVETFDVLVLWILILKPIKAAATMA